VGFLGRKVRVKGLDVLEAATDGLDNLDVFIAGPGALAQPIPGWVEQGPVVGDAAIRAWLDDIAVLVLPSHATHKRAEGLPVVLLEAWSCSVPVLGTRSGALRWLLPPAWSFEPGDSDALRRAMIDTAFDPAARSKEAVRARQVVSALDARRDLVV